MIAHNVKQNLHECVVDESVIANTSYKCTLTSTPKIILSGIVNALGTNAGEGLWRMKCDFFRWGMSERNLHKVCSAKGAV